MGKRSDYAASGLTREQVERWAARWSGDYDDEGRVIVDLARDWLRRDDEVRRLRAAVVGLLSLFGPYAALPTQAQARTVFDRANAALAAGEGE